MPETAEPVPVPVPVRVCALADCAVELTSRQARFCSREHARKAGPRTLASDGLESKVCALDGCDETFIRNPRSESPSVFAARKYHGHECARLGRIGRPQRQDHSRRRARRLSVVPLCPVRADPVPATAAPMPPVQPWRPAAYGWSPDGPRCVAR